MNNDNLMAFIGLLNRLWDGQDFDRNRLTVKSAQIKGRRLTVSLMMQPVVLARGCWPQAEVPRAAWVGSRGI